MFQLMQKEIFGQRFIVIENNYSFKEILDELHTSLNKKTPSYKASPLLVKTAQFFENIYSILNSKYEPIFTKATVQGSFTQNYYDNTLIKQTLNYSFIPIKPYIHSVSQKFLNEVKKI
ncbi:MAG: hypothetical protein KatS3mg027_2103 [Bacteroidia bacterium]|nr:MAG: hypothetical protein KatS3mg027_2103 [Bacteroidia bacterium]